MASLLAELRGEPLKWSWGMATGRGCYSAGRLKQRFVSEGEVRTHIRNNDLALNPYKRPTCDYWHMASMK